MGNIETEKAYLVVKIIDCKTYYDNVFHSKEKANELKKIIYEQLHQEFVEEKISTFEVKVIDLSYFD